MSDDPVRAALEKAAEKLCARRGEHASWCDATPDAAAAIAVFLRALPKGATITGDGDSIGWAWETWLGADLAAAVEKAARDA